MAHICKLCKTEAKSLAGLKCHLTVKHNLSYEGYKYQLKKSKTTKGMLKSADKGNNESNTNAQSADGNQQQAASTMQPIEHRQNVVDLMTYKEDKEAPNVQILTEVEAEKWGRLSAEQKNTLQAIKLYESQIVIDRQVYETKIAKNQAEIAHLKNVLATTVNPEYEALMLHLSQKYTIPRQMIGIHMDTRIIWDLRDSKEVPTIKEQKKE